MEIGANQGEKTLGIIQASQSFKSFELIKDYQQFDRILYAVKK
jgi:methylase of polypeptide subunit release factors